MHPIDFKGANVTWGEGQRDYLPLRARVSRQATVTCWKLSWRERLTILFTGKLWLTQLNFGQALQPQRPSVADDYRS